MKTIPKSARAFTLVELVVVAALIAVLVSMMLPALGGSSKSPRIKCVSNLKQIGLAFKVFAGDNNDLYPYQVATNIAFQDQTRAWVHFQAMSNELSTARVLLCPVDVARREQLAENFKIGKNMDDKSLARFRNESVSYFVGISMTEINPMGILSGDRNIAAKSDQPAYSTKAAGGTLNVPITSDWSVFPANKIHDNQGNLLLGDGSVDQASVSILQNRLKLATNSYGAGINNFVFPQ